MWALPKMIVLILVFWSPVSALYAVSRAFCQWQTVDLNCTEPGHVLLVLSARYGRMKVGRCVTKNYGYVGCSGPVSSLRTHEGRPLCDQELRLRELIWSLRGLYWSYQLATDAWRSATVWPRTTATWAVRWTSSITSAPCARRDPAVALRSPITRWNSCSRVLETWRSISRSPTSAYQV